MGLTDTSFRTPKYKPSVYINIPMFMRVIGYLLMVEGLFMLVPLIVALVSPGEEWLGFTLSICITFGTGLLLTLLKPKSKDMGKREAILMTGFTWVILSLFGMLPFLFYETHHSVTDAFFETISGFTTTGATTLPSLTGVPKSIIIWRCVTQWIGGLGIILFTLAILPMLNTSGGMQMFNAEVTGITHDKLRPRVSYTAKGLWGVYLLLTALLIGLLSFSEMDIMDAVCYGLSTMSTGGFATGNDGIHALESNYVKCVMIVFMFLGGVNFSLLFLALTGKPKNLIKNTSLKVYFWCVIAGTGIFILDIIIEKLGHNVKDFTIDPLFQSVSLLSSTGIVEPDFRDWGSLSTVCLILMMLIGACAGSTSGGAKIDRFVILFKFLKNEFYKMMHPGAVTSVALNGKGISTGLVNKTLAFLFIYLLVILGGGVVLSLLGLSLKDGLFCALQAISNTGLGTDATGTSGDYLLAPTAVKWILCFIMLVGRLEIFTVLLVFTKAFWKR